MVECGGTRILQFEPSGGRDGLVAQVQPYLTLSLMRSSMPHMPASKSCCFLDPFDLWFAQVLKVVAAGQDRAVAFGRVEQ